MKQSGVEFVEIVWGGSTERASFGLPAVWEALQASGVAGFQPFYVGGKWNATLKLYRTDGSRISCREAKRIVRLAQTLYPGEIR